MQKKEEFTYPAPDPDANRVVYSITLDATLVAALDHYRQLHKADLPEYLSFRNWSIEAAILMWLREMKKITDA